jgi:diguanylate cyclase (GGDEF)-like protein
MPAGPSQPLLEIEEALFDQQARKFLALRFPVGIERLFEQTRRPERIDHLLFSGLVGLALYDSFLLVDYFCLREFSVCLIVRLGIVTPLALLQLVLLPRVSPRVREAIFVGFTQLGAAGVLYLYRGTPELTAGGQAALILLLLYSNLMVGSTFAYACGSSALCLLGDAILLATNGALGVPLILLFGSLLLSAAALSLLASYHMERHERLGYLMQLRSDYQNAELASMNAELARLSANDPLTGIPNRRFFESALREAWEQGIRKKQPVSILMLDLDHFKKQNDQYGHPYGDSVLCAVARTLRATLRGEHDTVARYGGEEFIVILPNRLVADAVGIGERLRLAVRAVRLRPGPDGQARGTTVSVGAACVYPSPGQLSAELVEAADTALYQAKAHGRDRVWPAIMQCEQIDRPA